MDSKERGSQLMAPQPQTTPQPVAPQPQTTPQPVAAQPQTTLQPVASRTSGGASIQRECSGSSRSQVRMLG